MYTPLYIKTDNSLLTSMIKVNDLIEYAKKNNIQSLTITDNNMYGVMDFYKTCKDNNIKPIIGLEIEYNNYKVVFYCINYIGYKNLIKLCTIMSERKLQIEDIEKYNESLLCIIPYVSICLYEELNNIFGYVFIGYKNQIEKENIKINNKVYFNETLYLEKQDSRYIKYLNAIKEGLEVDLIDTEFDNNCIMSYEEYVTNNKDSLDTNEKITKLCNLELQFHKDLMPKFINEDNADSYTYLKKKCIEGLKHRFGDSVNKIYKERLKYELDIINKMGFNDYFLIVSDYVKYAKSNDIIVGTGRGSAVGSLVSYCLMITDVDPLKHDLVFERFLNPERVSMPDIDIDFEHLKREDVIKYCINKYGEKRVVPIITFGTLGAKQAVRDVSKVKKVDIGLVDNLCKLIDSNKNLKDNYNSNEKIKTLLDRKKELKEIYKIAAKFEGLKRHTSIHAAGVVMSSIDLDEIIPLDKSHDFYVSGYDMTYLEEIGLLKMDFLAIKYLTTIHNIISSINDEYNTNLCFDNIPLNDSETLKIFTNAETIGIFQFESDGMINFLKKLRVSSLDDIFAAIALFRPGPMKNIPSYIRRKNGIETVKYIDPSLEKILKSTYGIIIYQEQIMQIAHVMADYSLGEADILRKAMSKKKKELLLKEKEKFKSRALYKGYNEKTIDNVYEMMLKFAEYGFNKSHSIGYSIIAYKMAYLKCHYKKNFITYLLSMEINDSNKTKQYIYEAKKNNINILKPDINKSEKQYKIEENGIRFPLSNIKNIGIQACESIINERKNGNFQDIYDFICRVYGKSVTRKTIESLVLANVFESFGYNKKTLINNLDLIINYGELIRDLDRSYAMEPEIIVYEEYSKKELMEQELNAYGFYLTLNPITKYKSNKKDIVNINEIELYFDNNINIICSVDKIKEINTSKNEKMAFLLVSDELASIDVTLFPKNYSKYNDLNIGDIVRISGKVEKRYDKYQIVANTIEKISE